MKNLSKFLSQSKRPRIVQYDTSHRLESLCDQKQFRERHLIFHGASIQGYAYEDTIKRRGDVTDVQPEWVVAPVELFALEDFHVHSSTGVVFCDTREVYFVDFAWGWGNPRSCKMPQFRGGKVSQLETSSPIYVAAGHGYHGIVDDLSAILCLRRLGWSFKIVLEHDRKWMEQLLEVFGFADSGIIRVERNTWLRAPLFLATTKPAIGEFVHPELLKELRNATLDWTDDNTERKRLFISREKAPARAFSNEKRVKELFEKAGYSSVILKEMQVTDQIRLFANAHEIAGLHGAGLANLVWNQENASVLELYQEGKFNSCYSAMAAALGHSYRNLSVSGSVSEWSAHLETLLSSDRDR